MMDEFGLYPREEAFDPLGVMLFKALQVVAFLFFLALLAVSPDSKEGKIDSKAEFIITMDWPDNHPDDLDLFVQDPVGNVAWYRRREAGFLTLDRDDRGGANDFIVVNGKKISTPDPGGNRRRAWHRRGRIYRQRFALSGHDRTAGGGDGEGSETQSNGAGDLRQQGDARSSGQEKTALRFPLDAEGKVIDVHQRAEVAAGNLPQRARQRRGPRSKDRRQDAAP